MIRLPAGWSRRFGRLVGLALLGTGMVVGLILGPSWFSIYAPFWAPRDVIIDALRAAHFLYVSLIFGLPSGILAAGLLGLAAHRRGWLRARSVAARAMAVMVATVLAMAAAEAVAAVRLAAMLAASPAPWLPEHFDDPPNRDSKSPDDGTSAFRSDFPDAVDDAGRTVDVVILGESSACGDPYDQWFSVGSILTWKLGEAIPSRRFVLHNLAIPGVRLEQIQKGLETLDRRPDLAILYAGHNEISMRHIWNGTPPYYLDASQPPRPPTSIDTLGKLSSVCRLIDATIDRRLPSLAPVRTPERRLVDVPTYNARELSDWLAEFRARIEAITSYFERLGARVVLVIPPGNDADFEPSRSFLPPSTPLSEREAFTSRFAEARDLERSDPSAAEASYRRLLDEQPRFAETHYRLARLLEQSHRPDEATRHYVAARDLDGLPVRCISTFQAAYRETAARHPNAILIDGPAVLRLRSGRPAAGDNYFTDAMHPSLIGYASLADEILRALRARRIFGWRGQAEAQVPEVTPSECARHFGMDVPKWLHVGEYAAWFYLHAGAVRFDPESRMAHQARYERAIDRIKAGVNPDAIGVPGIGTRIVLTGPSPDTVARRWSWIGPSQARGTATATDPGLSPAD